MFCERKRVEEENNDLVVFLACVRVQCRAAVLANRDAGAEKSDMKKHTLWLSVRVSTVANRLKANKAAALVGMLPYPA